MDVSKIKEMELEAAQEELQKVLDEYKTKVDEIKDIEELKNMELDVDKEQEEFDKYLQGAEYDLNLDGVEFEGRKYTQSDVAKKIVYHLNRVEQDFQYCLGLHGLVLIWKKTPTEKISYGAYDSTLRLLGGLKFKGDSEWVDILVINNYLTCAHEPYIKDRAIMMTLAEIRNHVVNRIQLLTPNPTEVPAE